MQHVYWALENRLAGRAGPDEVEWELGKLRQAGFDSILSLHDAGSLLSKISAWGFAHQLTPLPETPPHCLEDELLWIRQLRSALGFLEVQILAGRQTLVHCHAGKDRTGIVLALALRRHEALSMEESISMLRLQRPRLLSAPGFLEWAMRVANQV